MTDALTDAVKRLKQLQADVERLKAGQDEEGEPRLFLTKQQQAVAFDASSIRANDVDEIEAAIAFDASSIRANDVDEIEAAIAFDASSIRANDVAQSENVAVGDTVDSVAEKVQPLYWNDAAWNTADYPDS